VGCKIFSLLVISPTVRGCSESKYRIKIRVGSARPEQISACNRVISDSKFEFVSMFQFLFIRISEYKNICIVKFITKIA
jgi:hypothetical protein